MSILQLIALPITCLAAVAAVLGAVSARRSAREAHAQNRTFTFPGGGEVTITAPMSQADYEALKARWLATYGRTGTVCPEYKPPTADVDSGLCARCGMSDYKHKEPTDA